MMRKSWRKQPEDWTIAIVGGGFAGATLAAQLLRSADASLSVVVIERRPFLGRGVAYATPCASHLLNVPVGNMSALADDPLHFLHWAQRHFDDSVKASDFLPRGVYGVYVESVLRQEITLRPGQFERKHAEACSITRRDSAATIFIDNGEPIDADKVVLALGNFPPSDPLLQARRHPCKRYIAEVWAADTLDRISQARSILLIGSGLTTVDLVVASRALDFKGTIHSLSRHGLLPRGHAGYVRRCQVLQSEGFPPTMRGLVRWVRAGIEDAQMQSCTWRPVIDSLRPLTQRIWQSLPHKERRRFLRHVRPFWEVHRHRLAPEMDTTLASELRRGLLQIHAGRITAYDENADTVEITYQDRKSRKMQSLKVDWVLNCTGPETNCAVVSNPLVKSLLREGLVRQGPFSLGLDVSDRGALIHADGTISDFLYAIGPLRKGNLWETTAVPEIRSQVSEMASRLLAGCSQKNWSRFGFAPLTATSKASAR